MNVAEVPPTVLLSIIVPIYQGSGLLDNTFAQLMQLERDLPDDTRIEIIAVDDGSDDNSYAKILENQKRYPGKIKAVKLSRNYGVVPATYAGWSFINGDCVANFPQDLQEPPELFLRMFHSWREGIKINIGTRQARDDPFYKRWMSYAYYFLFRRFVMSSYPKGGLCSFLIDRQICDQMRQTPDLGDTVVRLYNMGFSRRLHFYHRQAPQIRSNWTISKSVKLAIDNFINFSYMPVRLMSLLGMVTAIASIFFAAYIIIGKTSGWYPIRQPHGWATIVVLLTFIGGMLMAMLGIVGEYLWRILETVRKRPLYLIEETRAIDEVRDHAACAASVERGAIEQSGQSE